MSATSNARTLYVYWCPVCELQTERPWHSLRDGGLIPQNDTEHQCERVEVVPVMAPRDRLWVNEERTVLVRLWASGNVEVATRPDSSAIWGPPVYLSEERVPSQARPIR